MDPYSMDWPTDVSQWLALACVLAGLVGVFVLVWIVGRINRYRQDRLEVTLGDFRREE